MALARNDPYRTHNFRIEIDGIDRAGFREASGLETTTAPIDYREGTMGLSVQKLPGLVQQSTVTLRGGLTDDASLWAWRKSVIDGKVDRKNGSIVLLDEAGEEKLRWNFVEAWPSKWTGPALNATGNEVAIEALEITHEGLTRA
jgi:phage tail-like protein